MVSIAAAFPLSGYIHLMQRHRHFPLPWTDRAGRFSALKAVVFAAALAPFAWLVICAAADWLGPRPYDEAIRRAGHWAIRFLILSLAITPLRRLGWPKLILVRRMLGLTALSYALLHLTLYFADQSWSLGKVASEIASRVYLTIGFVALLGLIALGATSTDAMIRRMGSNWQRLHRAAYAIALLGTVHYFLQSKIDVSQATLIAGLFLMLMAYRLLVARGVPLSPPVLAATAVAAGLATAGLEAAWYGLATGVPAGRVLSANLGFAVSIRPAWWVAGAGLVVALLPLIGTKGAGRPARQMG